MRLSIPPSLLQENWTRHDYRLAYRLMRRGFTFEEIQERTGTPLGNIQAADYSYQAKGYQVNGWVSEMRRKRFYEILWRVLTQAEGIPF